MTNSMQPFTIASYSSEWFVGTGVRASSNVPFQLIGALIVVHQREKARFFPLCPPRRVGYNFPLPLSFPERKEDSFARFAAGIRINEHLVRVVSNSSVYCSHKTTLKGINMARCELSTASCFTPHGFVIPLPCGRWACPGCARTLATEWAIRARIGVKDKRAYFWTVTMPGTVKTPEFAYEILPDCWDKFRRVLQVLRDDWSYLAFVEGQPLRKDMPHFHMLSLEKCPIRLKDLAVACGFGYQASDETVTDKKAARYVSKYLTKQSPSTPAGFRRVRCSQDWPKLPDMKRQPLLVKSKGEFWLDYFTRVSDTCSLSISTVIERWAEATGQSFDDI